MKKALKLFIQDINNAKWAILFVIAYFAFFKYVLYSLCPMVLITGLPCPACGLTRAGMNVLHFHFARAWEVHPFIYPIIVLAIYFVIQRYIVRSNNWKIFRICAIILVIMMIAFYIYRMIVYFPGEPPISYYSHNMVARLFGIVIQ